MKFVHACVLLLLAAAVVAAPAAEAGDGCLVAPEERTEVPALPEGLWAVVPAVNGQRARVLFACQGQRVSGMRVRLVPGQAAEASLLLVRVPEYAPVLESEDGLPSEWVRVDSRRLDSQSVLVTLEVVAPASAQVDRVYSDQLSFGPANERLDVPVTLEIIDDGPLFRDEFDVDPVMGQFSMIREPKRAPLPSVLELASD